MHHLLDKLAEIVRTNVMYKYLLSELPSSYEFILTHTLTCWRKRSFVAYAAVTLLTKLKMAPLLREGTQNMPLARMRLHQTEYNLYCNLKLVAVTGSYIMSI